MDIIVQLFFLTELVVINIDLISPHPRVTLVIHLLQSSIQVSPPLPVTPFYYTSHSTRTPGVHANVTALPLLN